MGCVEMGLVGSDIERVRERGLCGGDNREGMYWRLSELCIRSQVREQDVQLRGRRSKWGGIACTDAQYPGRPDWGLFEWKGAFGK